MIKRLAVWWENWVFDTEQPELFGFFKLIGSILFAVVTVGLTVGLIADILYPERHVDLNVTRTWECTAVHEEYEKVYHGKFAKWEYVTECDQWNRKAGHEHDWSH